ncbi:MAG: 5-oxoprolinase subunit PxpB [Algibacter sp.]|uniref:5-oxoprolinase subunit PxpB n=1 Tax=Algibacter sp. TaxID=1872428 RepID=UPI0032997C05
MAFSLTYKPFGERSILINWPKVINISILKDILSFKENISKNNVKSIVELRSAYNSLLVIYNVNKIDFNEEIKTLDKIYLSTGNLPKIECRLWKIPVCYDACFGIDLEDMSEEKNCTQASIIKRHSAVVYTVYFLGFLPGFLYLGGLDAKLFTPRKATPRLKVEKGAVAIGGGQTGIYPQESPGGWNIIGNSPIEFFDTSKNEPCFAQAGDKIQFYSISLKEYKQIKTLVEAKVFSLESEVFYG